MHTTSLLSVYRLCLHLRLVRMIREWEYVLHASPTTGFFMFLLESWHK